jgi:hypothetical protein
MATITALAKAVTRDGRIRAEVDGLALLSLRPGAVAGKPELLAVYRGKVAEMGAEDPDCSELDPAWLIEQAQESGVLYDSETAEGDFDVDVTFSEAGGFDLPRHAAFTDEVTVNRKGDLGEVDRDITLQRANRTATGYHLVYHVG